MPPEMPGLGAGSRWLVLGDHFSEHGPANRRAGELIERGIPATPVATELFDNLRPGHVAVILGAYATRADARAASAALKRAGLKSYVKQSGAPAGGGLVRFWGRAEIGHATAKPPPRRIPIQLEFESGTTLVTTADRSGYYQVWSSERGKVSAEVDRDSPEMPLPGEVALACDGPAEDWFPAVAQVAVAGAPGSSIQIPDIDAVPDCGE